MSRSGKHPDGRKEIEKKAILLDISPEHYDRILSEFSEESRIYAILKNGLVLHYFQANNEIRTVEFSVTNFMHE